MSQDPLHPGRIFKSDVSSIWVKTWAQVLEDNRSRLQFFQERLEYEADKGTALRKLQDQHAKLLQGVLDDPAEETADDVDELRDEPTRSNPIPTRTILMWKMKKRRSVHDWVSGPSRSESVVWSLRSLC